MSVTADDILKIRLKGWIWMGIEAELELAELNHENIFLTANDPSNEDITYNHKRMQRLQAKIEYANRNIAHFEAQAMMANR